MDSGSAKQTKSGTNKRKDTRFKPGQSGNPKGRPPVGKSLAETVRRIADEKDPRSGKSNIEAVILKMFEKAKAGSVAHAAFLTDRGWGKPPQPIEAGGPEGGPLEIIVRHIEGLGNPAAETARRAGDSS
jgi:hypothetical protein